MSIDHSERGQGEPLVLIHGLFGTRENLGAIAKKLSESFHVFSIDLPNHGRSGHFDQLTLSEMASLVSEWMHTQNLDSAYFFGHSLGGKVAMELALTEPQKIKRLVVADIAPVKYEHRHTNVFKGLLSIDPANLKSRVDADFALSALVPEKPVRSFLLKNLQKSTQAGGFEWRMNLNGIHNSYADMISANSDRCVDVPVLFLKAEHSDYILAEHQTDIQKRFSDASFKQVANTGHWLHAEKPDLIARLTNRFLD